jgi:hypothetical protein
MSALARAGTQESATSNTPVMNLLTADLSMGDFDITAEPFDLG